MTTRTRQPVGTRRKPVRRPPARALTITFGPTSSRSRHPHMSMRRLSWLLARWTFRWTGRVAAYTGHQAIRRTAGHVSRTRTTWRAWSDLRGEHGLRTPLITDLFTGERTAAHRVDVDLPTGGDPQVRERQDEDAIAVRERLDRQRLEHMMSKRVRPPWWERWLAKLRLHKIDRAAYARSNAARLRVMAQIRERQAREAAWYQPAPQTPAPTSGSPKPATAVIGGDPNDFTCRRKWHSTRTQGDGSMANTIRTWADLAEPDIDPFEFPEELPEHFSQVEKLITEEAAEFEGAANSMKAGADTFAGYTEYLNTAQIDGSVMSPVNDANEAIAEAYAALRRASELMAAAATHAAKARQAAEAKYGDWDVPRFDRAG